MEPRAILRRPHDGLLDVLHVKVSELDHVARFQRVLRHFVSVDQNAVSAFEVTNSNALVAANELGMPPRQQRIQSVQLTRGIAPDDERADQEDFLLAAAVGNEELANDHGRTASRSRSISAAV